MLQGKNTTKSLYFIRIYRKILDIVAVYLLFFFTSIMFHASFVICFTNLATISWVVMFHVKHYVV